MAEADKALTTSPPDPSLERLRFVSTAVQYFGRDQFARITANDGAVYTGKGLLAFYDEVIVGPPWRADALHLPLAVVARVERYELRLGRALLVGAGIAVIGAILGAWRGYVAGDPLRYHDGLLLGAVFGSLAAPFVVWLAQGIPWLKRWRVIFDASAA